MDELNWYPSIVFSTPVPRTQHHWLSLYQSFRRTGHSKNGEMARQLEELPEVKCLNRSLSPDTNDVGEVNEAQAATWQEE